MHLAKRKFSVIADAVIACFLFRVRYNKKQRFDFSMNSTSLHYLAWSLTVIYSINRVRRKPMVGEIEK